MFGGTGFPFGDKSSNTVSVCNLETGHWRIVYCSGSIPDQIYGHVCIPAIAYDM